MVESPTTTVRLAGPCAIVGAVAATVMVALVAVTPLTVALIVALPPLCAVIKPLPLTVRTFVLPLVQLVAAPVSVTPAACKKLPLTVACWVPEPIMLVFTEILSDCGVRFVTRTPGPATALTATYTGETATFHTRTSKRVPSNC